MEAVAARDCTDMEEEDGVCVCVVVGWVYDAVVVVVAVAEGWMCVEAVEVDEGSSPGPLSTPFPSPFPSPCVAAVPATGWATRADWVTETIPAVAVVAVVVAVMVDVAEAVVVEETIG